MRELKLKYVIELASNIGQKARTEAQAVEQSQRAMQQAVDKTSGSVRGLDSAFMRFSANTATERKIGYLRRLGQGIDQVSAKMRNLAQLSVSALQKAPAAAAGAVAAFYTAKTLLDKPMDYDDRLRGVTNTAYAGQGIEALRAGKDEINKRVMASVRDAKGSTRDATLIAYDKLVGSGSFKREESDALLPKIMRTSVASGSDANDLVQASEKMKVTFGLTPAEIEVALAKLMRGGQEGGFEIKDSSKWIGSLAPYFKGYKGMAGVEAMVTMLQQVRSTAGTNDEAANNLRNFVQKMGSLGTTKDFKKQGINLTAEMAKGAALGQSPVDTYMAQLERVMAKQDPEGKARAAMRKVDGDKSLSPEEKKQRYDNVAQIYKSAGISTIINDLQEMGGYSGLAGTKEYGKKVLAAVKGETGGAVDVGYQFRSEGTSAEAKLATANLEEAQYQAFAGKSGMLNKLLAGFSSLATEFPALSVAAVTAAGSLTLLAAAAIPFAFLLRKNAGGPALPPGPGGGPFGKVGSPGAYPVLEGAKPSAATQAGNALKKLGYLGAAASMMSELFGTSDADLATLKAADDRKDAMKYSRGKGYNDPRLLTLTSPGAAEQALTAGQPTKIELGQGEMVVRVQVSDDRTSATTQVTTPMPGIRVSAGATQPQGSW